MSATKSGADGASEKVGEAEESAAKDDSAQPEERAEATSDGATKPVAAAAAAPKTKPAAEKAVPKTEAKAAGITVSPLALGLAAIVVVLAVLATSFGFLWLSAKSDADDAQAQLATATETQEQDKRAQDVATKYAVGAATVDYQNLGPWRTALAANTTPQLANTLQTASNDLEQLYVPLQWQSTATPLGSVVTSNKDGVIVVNVFVNVITKSTQRPQGIPSTATYSLTIDSNQNWVITDVRGIDAALGGK
ncbi:hypothetical protein [Tsukamurella sp. 1534]|uniref:hypothetical protein n=1 Tax=Tsukamurella sp. 1534 TaxID=1151061 RepID=UPI0002D6A693|nr:hypothetical protein [Tsukamurella sp. 1534]